jgi:broad specificity phosphatase PhoE
MNTTNSKPITSISFVRHGHVHNPKDLFYGRLPRFRLSSEGFHQAQAAARCFQNERLAAVFSSPLLRARQTRKAILEFHRHLTLPISSYLNEVHTPFDGKHISVVEARNWDVYTGVESQYEQRRDVLRRAHRFILRTRDQYPGQHVVAVTHGDVIFNLLLWVEGLLDLEKIAEKSPDRSSLNFYPVPGSITTLIFHAVSKDEIPTFQYVAPS